MAEELEEETLPTDTIANWNFIKLEDMEMIEGRYKVMIVFTDDDSPIWDMFLKFDKPLTREVASREIMHAAIKNWVLNILNSLAWVKWFHAYWDYLLLLGLIDWVDKAREQLDKTFNFLLESVSEEDYQKTLEERTAIRKAELEAESRKTVGLDD